MLVGVVGVEGVFGRQEGLEGGETVLDVVDDVAEGLLDRLLDGDEVVGSEVGKGFAGGLMKRFLEDDLTGSGEGHGEEAEEGRVELHLYSSEGGEGERGRRCRESTSVFAATSPSKVN